MQALKPVQYPRTQNHLDLDCKAIRRAILRGKITKQQASRITIRVAKESAKRPPWVKWSHLATSHLDAVAALRKAGAIQGAKDALELARHALQVKRILHTTVLHAW